VKVPQQLGATIDTQLRRPITGGFVILQTILIGSVPWRGVQSADDADREAWEAHSDAVIGAFERTMGDGRHRSSGGGKPESPIRARLLRQTDSAYQFGKSGIRTQWIEPEVSVQAN
jgi:hypothetical protein